MMVDMPSLDLDQSRSLLVQVVQALYSERHSPVPGALVKAQIIDKATQQNVSFSERELGFNSFAEFVKTIPEIGIQFRVGSDMLLAPASAPETLSAYAKPLPRLRRDFWRAFIEFPVPNTLRLYDEAEDKILYEEVGTQRKGILIEPISRDTQIQWRRQFAEEQPDNVKGSLLSALGGPGSSSFNDFARRLRENPAVGKAWNRYLQKLITDQVEAWAATNNISPERWSGGVSRISIGGVLTEAGDRPISQRAELYNLLDSLRIEDLLQLRVPLEWLLKVARDKK
jgi:hypothetical protein